MPEGPETLKQVLYLRSLFKHDLSTYRFMLLDKLSSKSRLEVELIEAAYDHNLVNISCIGKFYFIELGQNVTIVAHHGMDGFWTEEFDKRAQYQLGFVHLKEDGSYDEDDVVNFYYVNLRLGDFQILTSSAALNEYKESLAPGFIGEKLLTLEDFLSRLRRFTPAKRLRDILFDQHEVCSGLGNYLIAEIFYVMKFHPLIKLKHLDDNLKVQLFNTCFEVVNGHLGDRRKDVYQREEDPEGRKVERMTVGSRTAHWVPEVQIIGVPQE